MTTAASHHLSSLQKSRFLITGGKGMLAGSFARTLHALAPGAVVWAPGHTELDVCADDRVKAASEFAPDFILHCAAEVDADFCEREPAAARESIVRGTANIIELATRTGAVLFYPQSFLVYDGKQYPITEATVPAPLSTYGQLKLEAEAMVLARAPRSLSVRMAGFVGGYETDLNFVGKIVPHLAKLIASGTRSIQIGDRVWQPTYTDDLALNSLALLNAGSRGAYCMAAHGEASFYELTVEIVRILGLTSKIEVSKVDAAVLANKEPARRPLRAVMENRRLNADGLDLQRNWRVALADYLDSPYFHQMFQ